MIRATSALLSKCVKLRSPGKYRATDGSAPTQSERQLVSQSGPAALWGLAAFCLLASGCVSPYAYHCEDGCTPPTISGRMGDVPGWAPGQCGDCDGRGDCGDCDACGPCDTCGMGPCSCPPIFGGFFNMLTCGAGCGDIYWGEWINDPPDDCDPCDDCGNWIGPQSCCPPKGLLKLWYGLLGRRDGGCLDNCGCDDCAHVAPEVWEEPILSSPETIETVPAPMPDPNPSAEARRSHRRSARHSQHPDSRLKRRTTL
jgi:hypothetical protein